MTNCSYEFFVDSALIEPMHCERHFILTQSYLSGSAITGPIGKECADLWPRIASAANAIV